MTENEVLEKITEQTDAIDMIAKELVFLLTEAEKNQPTLGTPLAEELAQRFLALYEDFKRVRANAMKLGEEVDKIQFTDHVVGSVYKRMAHLLIDKLGQGLFAQFISVAEFGCLPDGTTFE